MLRSKGFSLNRQCALVKGLGLLVLGLNMVKRRQIVEGLGYIPMLRLQRLFPNCQCPFKKRLGFRVAT